MANDESPVIVQVGVTGHDTKVYHRDFPEIRSEGSSPADAAGHLANQLARALDSALTDWRRETLNKAVADVQAFVTKSR